MGILSTIWFLVRVIPKPSRATYPCMQVAAPLMSGFVVYLLSLGGISLAFRKAEQGISEKTIYSHRPVFAVCRSRFGIYSYHGIVRIPSALHLAERGPEDGPNQPFGKPMGINPGRVVWVWDPEATNENCLNTFESRDWYFKPENTNSEVVRKMIRNALDKAQRKEKYN